MGVDIFLESRFLPLERKLKKYEPKGANPIAMVEDTYRNLQASGSYFRNGYNSGDIMWAIIEARPLTREVVAKHMLAHMTNGKEEHPMTGATYMLMREAAGDTQPLDPPRFEELFEFLTSKRNALLAILRDSIALDEPLVARSNKRGKALGTLETQLSEGLYKQSVRRVFGPSGAN
jgi:hypothetical protein